MAKTHIHDDVPYYHPIERLHRVDEGSPMPPGYSEGSPPPPVNEASDSGTPVGGGDSIFQRRMFGGRVPVWVVGIAGGALLFLGFRWWRNKASGGATDSGVSPASGSLVGGGGFLPGGQGQFGGLFPSGGSNQFPGSVLPAQPGVVTGSGSEPSAPLIPENVSAPLAPVSPPASTVMAGPPSNTFNLGQLVNPATGEKIVSSVFSPVYGWLNETNLGGIYTGGGGQRSINELQYGGSYLGYASQVKNPEQERAIHGQFGGLTLLPGGGYVETNTRGEKYQFGS